MVGVRVGAVGTDGEREDCIGFGSALVFPSVVWEPFWIETQYLSARASLEAQWSRICLYYRRHKRLGVDPWVGKIKWRRKRQPTPVFLPGESHGQRSLVGYSPWGHKKLDTTEATKHTHTHTSLLSEADPPGWGSGFSWFHSSSQVPDPSFHCL